MLENRDFHPPVFLFWGWGGGSAGKVNSRASRRVRLCCWRPFLGTELRVVHFLSALDDTALRTKFYLNYSLSDFSLKKKKKKNFLMSWLGFPFICHAFYFINILHYVLGLYAEVKFMLYLLSFSLIWKKLPSCVSLKRHLWLLTSCYTSTAR